MDKTEAIKLLAATAQTSVAQVARDLHRNKTGQTETLEETGNPFISLKKVA